MSTQPEEPMESTVLEAERPAPAARAASADTLSKALLYLGMVGAVVLLDYFTKSRVESSLRLYDPVPVWGDFFRLTYIFNRGAAFGLHLGESSRFIFMGLAIIAVAVLFFMYRATPWSDRLRLLAIASVTGGAIGNLVDRIRSDRGVVDFLDFGLGSVRWPVFNVADIAVTIGAILLAVSLWKEEQRNEREGRVDASA
jgi:signal peptidase II